MVSRAERTTREIRKMGIALAVLPIFFLSRASAQSTRAQVQATPPTIDMVVQAIRAHDNERALRLSRELARARPADPRVWALEGIALDGLGRTQESLEALNRALEIAPDYVAALEAAAEIEFRTGSSKAEPLLQRLARLSPENETCHAMLGALAFRRKDCPAAVLEFQKSPHAIANNVPALGEYGACLFHLRRYDDALPVFGRIKVLQPGDWRSLYDLALVQFRARHYQEAIDTLSPLAKGPEARPAALNLIAAVYEANQETPRAVASLERAIKLEPRNVNNYLDLATLSLDHGAFKVGVDVVNAGLRARPDSPPLYVERGVLEVQLGQYANADADFQQAEALNPLQDYSRVALGISLIQQEKLSQSLQVVKRRLARSPREPVLNYLLAEIYLRQGVRPGTRAFPEAIAAARRALSEDPRFALAADVLAELYLRSGQTQLAEAAARRALKSDPNDQAAVYHLIVCLRRQGKQLEVSRLVKRLAKITSAERKERAARNRFKLVESTQPGGKSG